ncbi:MAG: single-stranded-DNA-specific exonuclease RecJ [Dissulfurimicrobium sp.]|uniref:single-stranded-DNA-specific exonuclease RecJ n=1 Tax=Dissulfurimicrobium TaxID=1769732 RepID=UPI001ED9DA7C|nr:single-stranded-DNA-specific exonuclease RecJ [Dissulfurimicrobium hydrothermale]UKL13468.1 single-stranded-DNA-specific exonuclease RecJ [Dissulfurimicrobium hydrothermale]
MKSIILGKSWQFDTVDQTVVDDIVRKIGIPHIIARLLCRRGIDSPDVAERHLNPALASLSDPWRMADMDKAVDRLVKAVATHERIAVFGDYDADGVTASVLMSQFLSGLGLNVTVHIPDRVREGYGLNIESIKIFKSKGISLVVTVDCGISNHQEIAFAADLGIDVIITDHHEPPSHLPPALAILNPKRRDCRFPFKEIAGVGVAFNLVRALRSRLHGLGRWRNGDVPNLKNCLDLVAIGTVADMAPLLGDNRIMVKAGLEVINTKARPGLKALLQVSGVYDAVGTKDISFRLSPRINAAGRMFHADEAFKLLVTDDDQFAMKQAERLNSINQQRQAEEAAILKEAQDIIKGLGERPGYVVYSNNWNKGVVGIVASKLMEQLSRPVILLAVEDGAAYGSGRSPDGVNLYEILSECAEHLAAFGGHKAAAGLHLDIDNLGPFTKAFETSIAAKISDIDLTPRLKLDCPVSMQELISPEFQYFFEMLEPFGPGYPAPVIALRDFLILSSKVVGNNHLKLTLKPKPSPDSQNGIKMELIGWGHGDKTDLQWEGLELACTPYISVWQERKRLELRLEDARNAA